VAVQQDEEGMCIFALGEYVAVLCYPQRAGFAQDLGEFLGGKSRKERQIGNQ